MRPKNDFSGSTAHRERILIDECRRRSITERVSFRSAHAGALVRWTEVGMCLGKTVAFITILVCKLQT